MILWILKILSKFHKRIDNWLFIGTGGKLSPEDSRDYVAGSIDIDLDEEVDLRTFVVEKKSQGKAGSCVAHALCSSIELQLIIQDPGRYIQLSERYSYYYGRIESGLWPEDKGMFVRDALKSAKKDGVSIEILCEYSDSSHMINKEPNSVAKSIAHIYGASIRQYYRVFSSKGIKEQLNIGLPVLINIPIFKYWFNNQDGNIRIPTSTDKSAGYHCILVVGYDDTGFICLNSWGRYWGDNGYCTVPYDYDMVERWVLELK